MTISTMLRLNRTLKIPTPKTAPQKTREAKKTNSRKHKKPQKPNKFKASLARLSQFIKASAAPILTSKFAQLLISAAVALHKLWRKRPKCPYTLYVVVMALIDAAAVTFIQWGMYSEPKYDDPNADYQDSQQRKRTTHQIRDANVARRRQAQLAS